MASAADIEYGLSLLKDRQASDKLYRDYYSGQFRLAFASSSFREAFGALFRKLGYNRCESVVDALADRMTVTGWTLPGEGGKAIEEKAADIWTRNRMVNRQNQVMKEAFMTGDSYVIVWPGEDGLSRFYPNSSHTVTVVYDDENPDHVDYAVKCWRVVRGENKGRWRVTVYEADVITRWITTKSQDKLPEKASNLLPYEDDNQPETANNWGIVPVIHFGNDANIGAFGKSELLNVLPLQDGLNKSLADMMVAGEYAAYPQRYGIGIEWDKDEESPFKPGIDRFWSIADEAAKLGQFDAMDMTQFIGVQDAWDAKIARVSRTPVHWLNQSNIPESGEALKTANDPFVTKVFDRIGCLTDPWADVVRLGLIQERATPADVAALEPTWKSPETRSEREFWTVAQLKIAAGVPEEIVWEEGGYTPDKIADMKALIAADRQRALVGIG